MKRALYESAPKKMPAVPSRMDGKHFGDGAARDSSGLSNIFSVYAFSRFSSEVWTGYNKTRSGLTSGAELMIKYRRVSCVLFFVKKLHFQSPS